MLTQPGRVDEEQSQDGRRQQEEAEASPSEEDHGHPRQEPR